MKHIGPNKRAIAKAIRLVDEMENATDGERQALKKRIREAAEGNVIAKGYIQGLCHALSDRCESNRQIEEQILDIILNSKDQIRG